MLVKRLENICLDLLLKGCNLDYFFERPYDFRISMYCQIHVFLTETCEKFFYFCKCTNWEYKSDMVKFCDWCLFYKDMMTFSADFNKIRLCSKIFKLVDVFDLFFRIINFLVLCK